MTISTTANRISYTGDGVSAAFTFPYLFLANADIAVYVDGVQVTTGFTTTGAGVGSGTVTFTTAPANLSLVVLVRIPDFLQQTALPSNGPFPSTSVERMSDKAMIGEQRLSDLVGRAIVLNDGDAAATLTLPLLAARASKFLVFDAAGLPSTSAGTGTDSGLRADLAASTGAALVGAIQSGTGATARTVQAKLREWFSVKDFGATGDGSTDDTAAIQAAITALTVTGGTLYFPPASVFYKVTSAITITGSYLRLIGSGGMSLLQTTSGTANIFTITGNYVHLENLRFASTPARTSGYFVEFRASSFSSLSNFVMTGASTGVGITGTAATGVGIYRGKILSVVSGGTGVSVSGSANSVDIVMRDLWITGASAVTQPLAGVAIVNSGDVTLDHVSTVYAGTGLLVTPGASQTVQLVTVNQCEFDSGTGSGINLNASANGAAIQAVRIASTWACTNTIGGVLLTTGGTGAVQDVSIQNSVISNNTGYGVLMNTVGVTNVRIAGTSMSANTTAGFGCSVNATRFSVKGCTLGACGQFAGNPYGIAIGNGSDNFEVTDNDLSNNTTGPMFNPTGVTLPGAPGLSYYIARNIGLATYTATVQTLTAAATTTSVTHGLAATPRIQDINLTPRSGWGTMASYWVNNPTATTFDIVTNANPGVGVLIAWQGRLWGG